MDQALLIGVYHSSTKRLEPLRRFSLRREAVQFTFALKWALNYERKNYIQLFFCMFLGCSHASIAQQSTAKSVLDARDQYSPAWDSSERARAFIEKSLNQEVAIACSLITYTIIYKELLNEDKILGLALQLWASDELKFIKIRNMPPALDVAEFLTLWNAQSDEMEQEMFRNSDSFVMKYAQQCATFRDQLAREL